MLLIRSLLFDALFLSLMAIMGILCAPLAIYSRGGTYWTIRNFSRISLWLLRVICGLRTEVRGPVPTGDVLIGSKHQSFLDILMHSAHLPRPRFIMKRELRWTPILGLYALRMGSTPVARGQRSRAMKSMVSSVERASHPSSQLVIYPQGTRVAPGAKKPFKIGAGVLYQRRGVPCIPAATNAGVFWGRKSFYRRPGLAVLEYLPEIPPGLPIEQFMARLRDTVETASAALEDEAGFVHPAPA